MEAFDLRVFGQRLRERRHDRDLSQQGLADLMEAPQGWISELENARQTHVQADTVFRLCRALGVSADTCSAWSIRPRLRCQSWHAASSAAGRGGCG